MIGVSQSRIKHITESSVLNPEEEIVSTQDLRFITQDKRLRVLIADDSPYNLFVNREMLSTLDRNIEITEALNGQQALDQVYSHQQPFDLILMDLHMPLMDGFEVSTHCIFYVHHEVMCRRPRDSGRTIRSIWDTH